MRKDFHHRNSYKSEKKSANEAMKRGGFFSRVRALLKSNRLGDLLVSDGTLSQTQLQYALVRQQDSRVPLGRILIEEDLLSRRALYRTLGQQWTLRCLAAGLGLFMTFSTLGGVKNARAGTVKDIPAQVHLVSAARDFAPVANHTPLFGSAERFSANITPFDKFTSMFDRFNSGMRTENGRRIMNEWRAKFARYKDMPLEEMAIGINDLVNRVNYITDMANYGMSDHWSTPIEFFKRGGDCEDFAIAKYTALRALGVPEERLRLAIVQDEEKNIPHAILIVYTNNDALVLDNQIRRVKSSSRISHYRPIFSINRDGWWLHKAPDSTVIAAAATQSEPAAQQRDYR